LNAELARIKNTHGHAVLFDAHSIRQEQPLLFDGKLPDLNLGSNSGQSAAAGLIAVARDAMLSSQYSLVVDGRFKGGYITRQYGNPEESVHALQLEMAQSVYMQEDPPCYREDLASSIRPTLQKLIESLMDWKPDDS
jgi:N-formylglutamate amidohydrolase